MNILSLDILACPIDKNFPLKLYIFSFDTKPEEMEQFFSIYQKRKIKFINDEKIIKFSKRNGETFLKDNIINKAILLEEYLKYILSKIDLLDSVINKTSNNTSSKCIEKITSEAKNNINEFSLNLKISKIEEILPDLFLINKFLSEVKIETGALFCQKCNRWFPIFQAIPHLLPDIQRDIKEEIDRFRNFTDEFNQFLKENNIII